MKVIIDRREEDYFIGRTEFDSPEVDPEVLLPIDTEGIKVGDFYLAKIIDSADFELIAE